VIVCRKSMEQRYGFIKSNPSRPDIDLVDFPGRTVALFGPNTYAKNQEDMGKEYTHTSDRISIPVLTFTPRTTAESIELSANAAGGFSKFAKPTIFNPNWLQAGYIIRDSEGVWVNPLDGNRKPITDMNVLKAQRDKAERVKAKNGNVFIGSNGFSFAEYGSFTRDVQEAEQFEKEGLALALENTKGPTAKNLSLIADKSNYPAGVNVWGFDASKEPILRVVSLYSYRGILGGRLDVDGNYWNDAYDGYAFGGFDSGEASAKNLGKCTRPEIYVFPGGME